MLPAPRHETAQGHCISDECCAFKHAAGKHACNAWLLAYFTAVWLAAFAEEQHQFFSIVWSDAHAHNLVNACERQVN